MAIFSIFESQSLLWITNMISFKTPLTLTELNRNGLIRLKLFAWVSLVNYAFSAIYSFISNQHTTLIFMLAAALSVVAALIIGVKFSVIAGQLIIVTALNANIFLFCKSAGLMGSSYMFFYPVLIASVFLVGFDKLNWHLYYVIICTTFFLSLTIYLSDEIPFASTPVETIRNNRTVNVWIVYSLLVTFVIILARLKYRSDQKLFKAVQQAEEAAKARTQFLSVMSHELRTPLNGIIGISHLLQTAESEEKKKEYLQLLHKSADHMLHMVGDILDYNKMDSNRLELQQHHFNIRHFYETMYRQFQQQFEQKGLYLKADQTIESSEEFVIGDDIRLAQVLYNLLGNALKFTKQGGAVFSMKAVEQQGVMKITFSISDTGVGIDAEDKQLIFKDFHQGKITKRHKLGGTGLGLSISKQILGLMGSVLYVDSEINKGSRFYFTIKLPVSSEASAEASRRFNTGTDFTTRNIRALVVEDNQVNAIVATSILKKWNAITDVAKNGKEAVEQVQRQQYDVILMDLEMPVMDGYAATAVIRSSNQKIPVIALTAALMEEETTQKLRDAGFNEAVSKPFKPEALFNTLQKVLDQSLST